MHPVSRARRIPGSLLARLLPLLLAVGCATAAGPLADPGPAATLARLHGAAVGDVSALVDVDLTIATDRHAFTAAVLMRGLEAFRLEALSPLGLPVFVMAARDGELVAWDVTGQSARRGPVTPAVVARATGYPLELQEALALLRGLPPLPARPDQVRAETDDSGRPVFTVVGGDLVRRIWLTPDQGAVARVVLDRRAAWPPRLTLDYRRGVKGELHTLVIEGVFGFLAGEIRYRQVTPRHAVPAASFELTPPPGTAVAPLDAP